MKLPSYLSNTRYWPYLLVMFLTLAYALGFFNIYLQPHSYEQASRWIYANIPAGSKLIGVHWDDRLPLSLPGLDQNRYNTNLELPLYEPDSPAKIKLVVARLAQGDYLVLPTMRLPGSLLRVPLEYPHMASLFGQLYTGTLGYKLIKTVEIEPAFPLPWNPNSADESFSVYDHPKVSIFQNIARLDPEELSRRIYTPPRILPALDEVMQLSEHAQGASMPAPHSTFIQILVWLLILELLGLIFFPFCALIFKNLPDRGYGASKACGVFLFAVLVWLCGNLKIAQSNAPALWCLLAILLLVSELTCSRCFGGWRKFLADSWHSNSIGKIEFFSLGVFLFFLVFRSLSPEIFWGEKPMDFTFLNYFVRSPSLPPNDPWAAGQIMHYYYLSSFTFAQLIKLGGINTAVGYNLAIATIPMLAVSTALSLFGSLGFKPKLAGFLALTLILVSDFEVLKLWILDHKPLNFDLFWASTRLFTSPGITEYPLWSVIFADLHAHLIALPWTLVCLLLCCQAHYSSLITSTEAHTTRNFLTTRAFLGVSWGMLFLLNSWDFITYGVVILTFALLRDFLALPSFDARTILKSALQLLVEGALVALAALLVIAPFLVSSGGAIHSSFGWVQSLEFNTASQVFRLLGHWIIVATLAWLLIVSLNIYRFITNRNTDRSTKWRFSTLMTARTILLGILCSLPAAMGLFSKLAGNSPPWGVLALGTLMLFIGCSLALLRGDINKTERTAALSLAVAGFLVAFAELRFVNDHMNTIFKFYNQIWILAGFGALGILPGAMNEARKSFLSRSGRTFYWVVSSLVWGALGLVTLASLLNLGAMATFRRTKNEVPSLVGNQYLMQESPDEGRAIAWINEHVKGLPVLLEAYGPGYQSYSRFAMHTGLPVVLGWDYHVMQRGIPWDEIDRRKTDIRNIYMLSDPAPTLKLLGRYNIKIIVVGDLERKAYGAKIEDKFSNDSENFSELFRAGSLTLYAVK